MSSVIALCCDSSSGLNQVANCFRVLRRALKREGNTFTPSYFILLVGDLKMFTIHTANTSCCQDLLLFEPTTQSFIHSDSVNVAGTAFGTAEQVKANLCVLQQNELKRIRADEVH